MIIFEEIKIGQNVYWVSGSNSEVRSGAIDEIRIKRDKLCCIIRGNEHSAEHLYLSSCDAEIESANIQIAAVKEEILERAKKLKLLRTQKTDSLTVKLAGLENDKRSTK